LYWLSGGFVFKRVVSPFHMLDPRVKLLVSIELFVLALVSSTLPEMAAVLITILLISLLAKSLGSSQSSSLR